MCLILYRLVVSAVLMTSVICGPRCRAQTEADLYQSPASTVGSE